MGVELAANSVGGARVTKLQANSPATSAGVQPGDLITAINGKTISTTEQFIATIDRYKPGDSVTLTVKRGGQTSTIKLTLGTRPASAASGG